MHCQTVYTRFISQQLKTDSLSREQQGWRRWQVLLKEAVVVETSHTVVRPQPALEPYLAPGSSRRFSSLAQVSFLPLSSASLPPTSVGSWEFAQGRAFGNGRKVGTDWCTKHVVFPSAPHFQQLSKVFLTFLGLLSILSSLYFPLKHLCWFSAFAPKHLGTSLLLQQFWIFWF